MAPAWRHWLAFAALSASYYAHMGLLGPYLPLWLQSIGFSVLSIAWLTALQSVTRVFAPYVWGWLSDRSGDRVKWLRWCASVALLWCAGLLGARSLVAVSILLFLLFSHTSGMMSMNEAAMAHLVSGGGGFDPRRYGRMRLFGSLGFMVTVLVAGAWFESRGLAGFPELTVLSLLCVVMAAWSLPRWQESVAEHPHAAAGQAVAVLPVLREKQVQWFLASLFFHILAHMGLYVFFSLYLHDLGYSKTWIGLLWAVAVVVEIVWFFTQGRWLPRLSLTGWLMLASALTSLRMGLTAVFGASLGVMLLLQCLHCITFAAHHTACVALISHYFPGRLRGRGQAIYTLVGYGLSGVLGGTLGGVLVTAFGLSSVYWACSVAALLGTYCAWRLWRLVHPDA